MQEDVENRTLTLIISGTKSTGHLSRAATIEYTIYRKEIRLEKQRKREMSVAYQGKQTAKQLTQQNQKISNIGIQDKRVRQSERTV